MPVDQNLCNIMPALFVFVFGACIGSFLNVCIYRIPAGISVTTPRSRCPFCSNPISWYDNIPLLSYLWLRARCRHCGKPVSLRYPGVELLSALLFLAVWLKLGTAPRPLGLTPVLDPVLIPVYWLAAAGLILASFVDIDHMIIPDRVSIGGIAAGIALSALLPVMHGADTALTGLLSSLGGAATGFFSLWAVALLGRRLFKKEAMGFGDVKLLGAMGAFFGMQAVFFIILLSSLLGSLVGIILVANRRRGLRARIPYGPFLACAALLWILWGPTWWNMYLSFLKV